MRNLSKSSVDPKILPILKEYKEGVRKVLGDRLEGIVLFGSQARGDARSDSDIDVLVLLKEGDEDIHNSQELISHVSFPLLLKYEKLVSTVISTLDSYLSKQEPLYHNIQVEGIGI